MAGGWRRLQNEDPHILYSSPNIKNEMGGTCNTHGKDEKCI